MRKFLIALAVGALGLACDVTYLDCGDDSNCDEGYSCVDGFCQPDGDDKTPSEDDAPIDTKTEEEADQKPASGSSTTSTGKEGDCEVGESCGGGKVCVPGEHCLPRCDPAMDPADSGCLEDELCAPLNDTVGACVIPAYKGEACTENPCVEGLLCIAVSDAEAFCFTDCSKDADACAKTESCKAVTEDESVKACAPAEDDTQTSTSTATSTGTSTGTATSTATATGTGTGTGTDTATATTPGTFGEDCTAARGCDPNFVCTDANGSKSESGKCSKCSKTYDGNLKYWCSSSPCRQDSVTGAYQCQ